MRTESNARRGQLAEGLNFFLICTVALLLFNGWFLFFNFQRVRDQSQWLNHTAEVMSELDLTLSSMKDAETGVRGYLLLRNDEYLEPYKKGTVEVWDHFNKVKFLTLDNPIQQDALPELKTTIQARLHVLSTVLDRARSTKKLEEVISLREGKDVMDTLRAQVAVMKSEEGHLMAMRAANVEQSQGYFYASLLITTILSVVVIMAAFVQIRRAQIKGILENELKAAESWQRGKIAELAQSVAGDLALKNAARRVLDFVANTFDILGANVYVLEDQTLKRMSSFAGEAGSAPEEVPVGHGLLGEAVTKNKVWEITDVPTNYLHVESSLGKSDPKNLVFVPFEFQGRSLGVIEIAMFEVLRPEFRELLKLVGETIGVGLNAAQARDRVQLLLEKTQLQSEELYTQQEELRTSNEELEQQTRALESQQQSLNLKNAELERSQLDIETKATELVRANQYKSEFLAKMSHELRTPLNSLLILSTLLIENKERNLTAQQKEFASSIYSAGNDLLNLINDILDLSKIEARKLNLRPETFALSSLFEQLRMTFQPQTEARKLGFELNLHSSVELLKLTTDRQRLEQILRNFLSNAIKFTEAGKIRISARLGRNDGVVLISVTDTGVGIPENKKELVFEAFEQADSSVSRKYGGTGLGLTISRELAILLGGQISVESKEGEGSTFTLELPTRLDVPAESTGPRATDNYAYAEANPGPKAPITRTPAPPSQSASDNEEMIFRAKEALKGIDPEKKSILIVEDDSHFRKSVAETVRTYGFQSIEASDGELALEIFKTFTPAAILLDIRLPGISGLGVLEIAKQMPRLRHVPIHMISALEYQQNSLRLGALGYLTKPVTLDKVRSALARIENLITKNVKKLLIVEDDPRQLNAIKELITGPDVDVRTTTSGEDALKVIESEGFDCIILDLSLPDVSGFDLLNRLNGLEISLPPVVIYTGKDLSREEEEHLRKYSESIIIKGARSPERLLDEVNLFLHRVEALLPESKREMLSHLRAQEKSFEGKTVLVVDDDLRNVFALTSALEGKGLIVKIARNGLEALDAVKSDDKIDVVLMDLMMPKMDGLEAIRHIRAMDQFKNLPIIALTAKAMKEDQEKCIAAGANDYLPKPINLTNLTSVLKVWLTPKGIFS